jgi:hypothetical protein
LILNRIESPNELNIHPSKDEIKFWKSINFDDILLSSDETTQKAKRQYMRFQSNAGQAAGLSFLLKTDVKDYLCANHDSFGFRV